MATIRGAAGKFFEANDITGEDKAAKRRATFLSVIGAAPYKLQSLIAPMKPTDKTFEELVAVLTEHYIVRTAVRGHATDPFQFPVAIFLFSLGPVLT